ncbi:MAG: leucine-rich repeat domain-containing protein, partial [Bacteroidales bacterium]|nr:leucine-rich repeat domain-containing protein [Bacteroidales bacterium]
MKRILFLFALFAVCCVQLPAQSFKYVYKGIEFRCKIEDGKAVIRGFDQKADRVVIPAQVTDKRGRNYSVSKLDFLREVRRYTTSTVAIEAGVEEIEDYCFALFHKLTEVYIPNTITRIGKKAFNAKYMPARFHMPSAISETALKAGNVVYPYASTTVENPLASIDLSAYGDGQQEDVATQQDEVAVPQTQGITPG